MNRTSKDIDSYMWSSSNHGSNSAPKNEDEGDFEHYSPQSFGKRASRHDSFILDAGEVRQTDEEPRNGHEKSWPTSVSGSTLTEASDTENVADLEQNVANDIPPTPAPFWSENLKSTRRVVFRKYVITRNASSICCRYSADPCQSLFFASSFSEYSLSTGEPYSASRIIFTASLSPLWILMVK